MLFTYQTLCIKFTGLKPARSRYGSHSLYSLCALVEQWMNDNNWAPEGSGQPSFKKRWNKENFPQGRQHIKLLSSKVTPYFRKISTKSKNLQTSTQGTGYLLGFPRKHLPLHFLPLRKICNRWTSVWKCQMTAPQNSGTSFMFRLVKGLIYILLYLQEALQLAGLMWTF